MKYILLFLLLFNTARASDIYSLYDDSYILARSRFLEFAKIYTDGVLYSVKIPSKVDKDLTTDILYINKLKANKLLILSSGNHGTESGAGSFALNLFLKEYAKRYTKVSILLIHSLNPYGHKYDKRNTENNIDLNRNFFDANNMPIYKNEAYAKFSHILNPVDQVGSIGYWRTSYRVLKELVTGTSIREFRQATAGGQNQDPQGVFYAGKKQERIVQELEQLLPKIFHKYNKILHLDFHTGLGKQGSIHILKGNSQSLKSGSLINKIFKNINNSITVTDDDDDGFYKTNGDFIDFMNRILPDKLMISVGVEYGTLGIGLLNQIYTLNILIKDNQGRRYGFSDKEIKEEVKIELNNIFYPSTQNWRNNVADSTALIFKKILDDFNSGNI